MPVSPVGLDARTPLGAMARAHRFDGLALATPVLATLVLAAGCNSTGSETSEGPVDGANASATNASATNASATNDSSRTLDVRVSGAEGTLEGDTLKLDYPEATEFNDRIPEWVINPTIGGVTGAVGVAARSGLGVREQLDEARLNGRLEIASMLEVRVQRVGRSELELDLRAEGGDSADRGRRSTLGVDRNILDSVLAGSRQRALWLDDETGEVFVWMVLDGAVLGRADHVVVEGVSVFTANQAISREYRPDRTRLEPPTVIVNMPEAAAPAPAPEEPDEPQTPIEELEENLKPIETIPTAERNGNQ